MYNNGLGYAQADLIDLDRRKAKMELEHDLADHQGVHTQ